MPSWEYAVSNKGSKKHIKSDAAKGSCHRREKTGKNETADSKESGSSRQQVIKGRKTKMSAQTAGRLTGLAVGLLVGIILLIVILKATKKDGKIKCRYDERQEITRGKAFKYGFFTLIVCNFLYGIGNSLGERVYVDPMAGMFLSICIGITVYASYCIWHESYFSLNENPKRVIIAFVAIGLFNAVIGVHNICDGSFVEDGVIGFHCTNLICSAVMFVIVGVIAAKQIALKREAQ